MPTERHNCPDCGAIHRVQAVCRAQCNRPVFSEGMCHAHYNRWKRGHGSDKPINPRSGPTASTEERFRDKIQLGVGDECDVWQANTYNGYGRFQAEGKHVQAHRYAYELVHGPIPEGLELDHLCRNRTCVKVAHLEPVTHTENVRRSWKARRSL